MKQTDDHGSQGLAAIIMLMSDVVKVVSKAEVCLLKQVDKGLGMDEGIIVGDWMSVEGHVLRLKLAGSL